MHRLREELLGHYVAPLGVGLRPVCPDLLADADRWRDRHLLGGGHQFDWYASEIAPLDRRLVKDVEIPPELFRDVHESVAQEAFVFWARFTDASGRPWEVVRDAHTKQAVNNWIHRPRRR